MDESKFAIPQKISKTKKVNYRCPRWAATKMLNGGLIKKYELRSYQELFEYLIISGVVYLKPEVIEFLKKEVVKYRTKFKVASLVKLGKLEKSEMPNFNGYMQLQAFLYEQDFHSLNNFCIENNVRPVWVYHSMFVDGFCAENPIIINLIKECKDKKIRSRKNTVARLVKDKYVEVLGAADCKMLLGHLTTKFDKGEFDVNLIEEIAAIEGGLSEEAEASDLDKELNEKFISIKRERSKELEEAVNPIED